MTKQGCNEFKLNSLKLITLSYCTSQDNTTCIIAQHFFYITLGDSIHVCFSACQIKQAICVFCICKRYACCLFWDLEKLYPSSHKTAEVSNDYWCDKNETLSKTGKE